VGGRGWGGDGGGSGRRKSEAAGLEERRGGPRGDGDGDGPGREEERKGGRHSHGSSGGNGGDGGGVLPGVSSLGYWAFLDQRQHFAQLLLKLGSFGLSLCKAHLSAM
jgi:hypothetical protein